MRTEIFQACPKHVPGTKLGCAELAAEIPGFATDSRISVERASGTPGQFWYGAWYAFLVRLTVHGAAHDAAHAARVRHASWIVKTT